MDRRQSLAIHPHSLSGIWYELAYQFDPDSARFTSLMQLVYSLGNQWRAVLTDWLYGTTTPTMPGHPEWPVDPVEPTPADQALAALSPSRGCA